MDHDVWRGFSIIMKYFSISGQMSGFRQIYALVISAMSVTWHLISNSVQNATSGKVEKITLQDKNLGRPTTPICSIT